MSVFTTFNFRYYVRYVFFLCLISSGHVTVCFTMNYAWVRYCNSFFEAVEKLVFGHAFTEQWPNVLQVLLVSLDVGSSAIDQANNMVVLVIG